VVWMTVGRFNGGLLLEWDGWMSCCRRFVCVFLRIIKKYIYMLRDTTSTNYNNRGVTTL
jgi:hypothetical protein